MTDDKVFTVDTERRLRQIAADVRKKNTEKKNG